MFLKELELTGFKSFPERTTLKFKSGITAIVGPNGCGKSNVFDGIRWVLGEQSTKTLRSMKMEDVIFSGTNSKPPLGMAEVSLIFSNKSRHLFFDSDEIEVRRRIFRSGESQYLLNKAPVRLKDILDLFMGTGIGSGSYSLVQQGQIDLILSTRPEERRLIFDEVSGITKYKAQKREALGKLEETEQNLLRINDIIAEVRREINSLERQVNKARRYKETFEELKSKEINLATLQIIEIDKQKQELFNKINTSGKGVSSYEGETQEIQKEISLRLNRIKHLEKEISYHHDKLINIDNLINNNIQRIQINQERITELNSRILTLEQQRKDARTRIEVAQKNLENFQKEYSELREAIQQRETRLSEKQKEYEQVNLSIKSSQEKIKQTREQILDSVTNASRIRNEIVDLQAYFKSQVLRKKRLDIEKVRTREEKENLQGLLNQRISELDNVKCELDRIDDEVNKVRAQQDLEFSAQERSTQDIQDLENDKIALQSQKEFLQDLRLKYEDINQSLDAVLFIDRLPEDDISGIVMRIEGAPVPIEKQGDNIPGNLTYQLAGEAKPIPFETQAIEQRIIQIQADINKKQEGQRIIQSRIQELNQSLGNLEQKAKAQAMSLSNKSLHKDNLAERLNKINQEYEVLNLELQDLEDQIKQLNNKQTELEEELNHCQEQQKMQEETVSRLEGSIVECRSLREQNLIYITQIKTEIENQNASMVQQERTQTILENAYQESQQLYQRYSDEIQESQLKIMQLSEEMEKLERQNLQAEEDKKLLVQSQDKQQVEFRELNSLQEQDSRKVLSLGQNMEELKEHIYEYQMRVKDLDFEDRSIRDRVKQVYKVEFENLPDLKICQEQNREILNTEITELNKKLDSYGTVNLIAIEEYEELKKRYDFLTQQQDDLNQARQSLNEAINKINRTTKHMFLDAFKKIQAEFHTYFRLLFGGGEAQIMLTEESNPLESGIEIICRPPGKKLQNVLALSGGEKALSAVALIFAIFKVKPAPFCVLDEIDAPLDEANIGRFSEILQDFAKTSQFLIITHNKRTILNADVMYGITMQDSGISKIVSVKLSGVT